MRKHFKLLLALCTIAFVLAISAAAATDFTGYTPISDAGDLLKLMNSTEAITGKYYLTDDITLPANATQSPIGEPSGKSFGLATAETTIFDGNGHTVKGVDITGNSYIGFFGVVANAEIRNLTIEGKVTTKGSHSGALVGFAKTSIVIENCVNNCVFSSTSQTSTVGKCCGGILGNTEADTMKYLKISGCTNNATITASFEVGGIAGKIQSTSGATILIENCVNNGKVDAKYTGGTTKAGGILGTYTSANATSFTVTQCRNAAEVAGYYYMGGIIGELTGTDSSATSAYANAKFHVTKCWNDGTVTSTRTTSNQASQVGGIIGYVISVGDVCDCLNTGTISAKLRRVGGLFGESKTFLGAKNNLNRANILLNSVVDYSDDYVNSIGGYLAYKPYGINYYTGTLQGKVWSNDADSSYKSTQYNSTLFDDLNADSSWVNPVEPVLDVFKEAYCEKYGHASTSFSAGDSCVIFTCAICETEFYKDTTVETTVYVDETTGILAVNASADKDIGTSTVPFKSLTEAFEYAAIAAKVANSDVTINIVGTATLADSYETPDTEKTITVTGGTLHFGGAKIANRHLYLGGPVVFENIKFTSAAAEVRIYAQNNKLVMGEGIKMGNSSTATTNEEIPFTVNGIKMLVMGGFYSDLPTSGMATDITVRSGEYYIVAGWNYMSSAVATTGTSNVTVGKTDVNDTLKICDLAPFTIGTTLMTDDSTGTMVIDGDADIGRIIMSERSTSKNAYDVNYITHLILRGAISESYRNDYMAPYGFDITGGKLSDDSLGYHTFRIFTDGRAPAAVYAEHAFFGGDGFVADETLTTGGYKPVSAGGDTTMTQHTYMEYCATYMGGHNDGDDEDTLCDECGADLNCAHANAVPTVETESTCTVNGYEYTFCHDCGIMASDRDLPLNDNNHNYVWEAFDGGYRYVCTYNSEHVYCTYNSAVTEFYVSDNGKADGGFSASYPSNDFDSVMKLAAACGNDATVYIVGTVTLPDNDNTDYEVYIEPDHTNTITVCGYKDSLGVVKMGSRNTRLEYVLSGDTTFQQIEFNTGISTNYLYITAHHNHLVMGEKITTSTARYSDSTKSSSRLTVVGGCDNTIDSSACDKTDTHVTLHSGTYYMVVGGSSIKGCGLENGTVNIEVLGDITVGGVVTNKRGYVDRQFILGSYDANVGDINMVIDGNITCTNAFCIASYGVRTAGDVSITIKSGSLVDYSFSGRSESAIIYDEEFAANYKPTEDALATATVVIFPLGNTHSHATRGGVMKSVDNVYINYNANIYSTVQLAERFRLSLGGSDNFHMDVLPEKPCTSSSGMHTPSGVGTVVLEATCRGEGSKEYTCTVCGITYAENIARLDHSYGDEISFSEANCISPAINVKVCGNENCGYKLYTTSGEVATTHTYENGICVYCNASVQALCTADHSSIVGTPISVGCGDGFEYTCTALLYDADGNPVYDADGNHMTCGKTWTEIESADHKFGAYTVTVQPTATEPGIKTRTCKSCGKVETAIIYADGSAVSSSAIATDANGNLAGLDVVTNKLTSAEKSVLNALLQDTSYGSEVKVSYQVEGDSITNITYSIPLPVEYADMQNVQVIVKDDDGKLHVVQFTIDKGYIVFTF